jgi:putative transposase
VKISSSWLGEQLDVLTVRALADRAITAVDQYIVGRRGRPRFKGPNSMDSLEGKSNKSGIRFKNDTLCWRHLRFALRVDHQDQRIKHALGSPIVRVRIVRRRLRGKTRYWAQLVCAGKPYVDPDLLCTPGVVGIDPGPRRFAVVSEQLEAIVELGAPLAPAVSRIRRLQRSLDRKRRAGNPQNYLPTGQVRPGRLSWQRSKQQQRHEQQLSEAHRILAARRRNLNGRLCNSILVLGRDIRIEKNSYRSFQRRMGRSIRDAAPSALVSLLRRKAENAGARVVDIPAGLRLSQTCHGCGAIRKKPLSLRVHSCACGIGPVQRDLYSALLLRSTTRRLGRLWKLDVTRARRAWMGVRLRLPAASSAITIEEFVSSVANQAARSSISAARPESGQSGSPAKRTRITMRLGMSYASSGGPGRVVTVAASRGRRHRSYDRST